MVCFIENNVLACPLTDYTQDKQKTVCLGDITAQTGCVPPPHYNNVTPPQVAFVVGCPGYGNNSLKRADEET